MHVKIVIKVKADDAKEARDLVQSALDSSCEDESASWDYVGGLWQVVEKVTNKDFQISLSSFSVKSYAELEKKWHQKTLDNKKRFQGSISDSLFVGLMDILMPSDEVPLYLDKKGCYDNEIPGLKEKLEKIFKNPDRKELTYEEIIERITACITDNGDSMFSYYLNCVEKINSHLKYPENHASLHHSTDIHFYDMTEVQEEDGIPDDSEVFYFLSDRHC